VGAVYAVSITAADEGAAFVEGGCGGFDLIELGFVEGLAAREAVGFFESVIVEGDSVVEVVVVSIRA